MEQSVLHSDKYVIITLVVEDDDDARIDVQSTKHGIDLTVHDDVVVIIDGQGVPVAAADAHHATAHLGPWEAVAKNGFQLMIRVGEFVEGWEFDPAEPEE
ncbi:MAG: hypothetical protein AAGI01_14255 [Myxococcota bacterium]